MESHDTVDLQTAGGRQLDPEGRQGLSMASTTKTDLDLS